MERKPQVFDWVPMEEAFVWMAGFSILPVLLIASVSNIWVGLFFGAGIGVPVGYVACLIYNLCTKPFINKEGVDQFQKEIHSIRRWMKPPEDR